MNRINTGKFTDWCREAGGRVNKRPSGSYDSLCEIGDTKIEMMKNYDTGGHVRVTTREGRQRIQTETDIDDLKGGGPDGWVRAENGNFSTR